MFPSIVFLPLGQCFFGASKRMLGIVKTVALSHRISDAVLNVLGERETEILPQDMVWELRWIHYCMPRPWIACFETACAFEVWLAFHRQRGRVCIGKRMENGHLIMHAWVQCKTAGFFDSPGFEEVVMAPTDLRSEVRNKI